MHNCYSESMTEHNNSNDEQPVPNQKSNSGNSKSDFERDWQEFTSHHADELSQIERSRDAKRFEKQARKTEKLMSINDIDSSLLAQPRGPRDYTKSSWLNTDAIMDQNSDFVAPNPHIAKPAITKLVLWALFIGGIAGVIASVFFPMLAALLGAIFGLCTLVGASGLILTAKNKGLNYYNHSNDDGARV